MDQKAFEAQMEEKLNRIFHALTTDMKEKVVTYKKKGPEFTQLYDDLAKRGEELVTELSGIQHKLDGLSSMGWAVLGVCHDPKKPLEVRGILYQAFDIDSARPVVTVNGTACNYTVNHQGKNQLIDVNINLRPALGNPRTLNFGIKSSKEFPEFLLPEYNIPNPYYLEKEWLDESSCTWQCQGHRDEKLIMIVPKEGSTWNQAVDSIPVTANFDILSNGRKLGTFPGVFLFDGALRIKIPSINKEDCIGKRVELRVSHAQGIKAELPSPTVVTVNHEFVGLTGKRS